MKSDKLQARMLGDTDWEETGWSDWGDDDYIEDFGDMAANEFAEKYHSKYDPEIPAHKIKYVVEVKNRNDRIKKYQISADYSIDFCAYEIDE
jgi:hypothetical protein